MKIFHLLIMWTTRPSHEEMYSGILSADRILPIKLIGKSFYISFIVVYTPTVLNTEEIDKFQSTLDNFKT